MAAVRAATDSAVATGRYERTHPVPVPAQMDPLGALVEVRLSGDLRTVGDGMTSLLRGTGYRLVQRGRQMRLLTARPLASVQRFLGPMTVRDALRTLAGAEWDLLQDPVHRLVAFELLPPWNAWTTQEDASGRFFGGVPGREQSQTEAAFSEPELRLFRVRAGSLRSNVKRLVELWQRRLVGWDITLNGAGLDWTLHTDWVLEASSLEKALEQLLVPHGLRAVLHARDGAVSIHRADY